LNTSGERTSQRFPLLCDAQCPSNGSSSRGIRVAPRRSLNWVVASKIEEGIAVSRPHRFLREGARENPRNQSSELIFGMIASAPVGNRSDCSHSEVFPIALRSNRCCSVRAEERRTLRRRSRRDRASCTHRCSP